MMIGTHALPGAAGESRPLSLTFWFNFSFWSFYSILKWPRTHSPAYSPCSVLPFKELGSLEEKYYWQPQSEHASAALGAASPRLFLAISEEPEMLNWHLWENSFLRLAFQDVEKENRWHHFPFPLFFGLNWETRKSHQMCYDVFL